MDDDAYDDDEYEEEGPSLAYPPLYLLRSTDRCPECGRGQHVFLLACTGLGDALYGGGASEEVHFLRRIESLPEPLLALLQAKLPRFTLDATFEDERPYLMNHCPCGAKLDDYFVAGDVGAAFWPDTPDGYR